jgi:hypothetical protein
MHDALPVLISLFTMASLTCSSNTAIAGQRSCAVRCPAFKPVRIPARRVQQIRCNATEAEAAAKPLEKSGPNFKAAKDIDAIMATLPHRYSDAYITM